MLGIIYEESIYTFIAFTLVMGGAGCVPDRARGRADLAVDLAAHPVHAVADDLRALPLLRNTGPDALVRAILRGSISSYF